MRAPFSTGGCTWYQTLTFNGNLVVLRFQRGDDDGAGVSVVVVVQDGGLCVVAVVVVVVVERPGLQRVGTVVS